MARAFLVAPTEKPPISSLGPSSLMTEEHGVDILWKTPTGMSGIQRKEYKDLVASVSDKRLGKEIIQMRALESAYLVVEGVPQFSADGTLMDQYARWDMKSHWGVMLSIQSEGIGLLTTRNQMETVAIAEYLYDKTQKPRTTSSLIARNNPQKNGWGKLSDRDTFIHVMSGCPGFSTKICGDIYDHFGGPILGLTVSVEELLKVPGVGKKRAEQLMAVVS